MTFYKPQQGDTAATVADGYDNNFQTLDTSKADAAATLAALDTKVDKVDGAGLMTDEEREKLAGIEAGANAYTHPKSHPANMIADTAEKVVMTAAEREKLAGIEAGANVYSLPPASAEMLGGVKAGDNVNIAEDGTLSATAEPYELPKASASVLGGIKVGNNLSMREDGTLDAEAGGGGTVTVSPDSGNTLQQRENGLFVPAGSGGGGGAGILVLPYVAPERDAEGNIANSAAFVAAWGPILSQYLAVPDQHSLYIDVDVSAGDGTKIQMPCTLLNIGGDGDAAQWLISGFTVVNIPASSTTSVSCKATCMVVLVCNTQGQILSVEMYAATGLVGPDGQPNLLGGDDPLVIDMNSSSETTIDQRKAELQPAVEALQLNPHRRVMIRVDSGIMLNASVTVVGNDFAIAAIDPNPITFGDPNSTWLLKIGFYCQLSNGTIQTVQGGIKGFEVATTQAMNVALAGKAPLLDYSILTEQLAPGEFWLGTDGVARQVYIRTFNGVVAGGRVNLSSGVYAASLIYGFLTPYATNLNFPASFVDLDNPSNISRFNWTYYNEGGNLYLDRFGSEMKSAKYFVVFKYTKA